MLFYLELSDAATWLHHIVVDRLIVDYSDGMIETDILKKWCCCPQISTFPTNRLPIWRAILRFTIDLQRHFTLGSIVPLATFWVITPPFKVGALFFSAATNVGEDGSQAKTSSLQPTQNTNDLSNYHQCPTGRFFFSIGSGIGKNKEIPGSESGLGGAGVLKCTIEYFLISFLLSGISGYFRVL